MEGNDVYTYIHTIRRQLDDTTDAVIEDIVKYGKSDVNGTHRNVHSIIACITKQVNERISSPEVFSHRSLLSVFF